MEGDSPAATALNAAVILAGAPMPESVPRRNTAGYEASGAALVIVLMVMIVMLALGSALIITTTVETTIAGHFREQTQALYAAEAMIARVLIDLRSRDFTAALSGAAPAGFADGPPVGSRTLLDSRRIDLVQVTNEMRCGKPSLCSEASLTATSEERPWGPNNPRWQLYSYGFVGTLVGDAGSARGEYVLAWLADDPSDDDGDPLRDGAALTNPGRGVIMVLACAYGTHGVRRIVQAMVQKIDGAGIRIMTWNELR